MADTLGLGALLVDAQLKLLASLPPELRSAAGRAREIFHLDESRWFTGTDSSPLVAELARAATERLRVVVDYRRKGKLVTETLEPLGLVLKAGVWYLLAGPSDPPGTYRVSRIASATVTAESFRRPADFDLVSGWERSREKFESSRPRVEVALRVDPGAIPTLRAAVDWSVRPTLARSGVVTPGGQVELTLTFERLDYAYADLVQLGGLIEVLEPAELRERLALTGQQLMSRYGVAPDLEREPAA